MRLYLGSRDYCPAGYLTVDINPQFHPDILADVTDLANVETGTVDEICASHILEHLPWPTAFKALAEWARVLRRGGVLRVAVPDLAALGAMLAEGRNAWGAAGLIYGLGRLTNPLEAHQYGYTRGMLLEVLRSLGFGGFGWWKHDLPDASNGWLPDDAGNRIAMSLNISAEKHTDPVVSPEALLAQLTATPMMPFGQAVANCLGAERQASSPAAETDPLLTQQLHYALIEARMRIVYLENEMQTLQTELQAARK